MLFSIKRGAIYYSKWLTYLETICDFFREFEATVTQLSTFHMDPHLPTHVCPTKKESNGGCLRYVVFECHANFQIIWEAFAHRDQQKTC